MLYLMCVQGVRAVSTNKPPLCESMFLVMRCSSELVGLGQRRVEGTCREAGIGDGCTVMAAKDRPLYV